ncbi:hypothetical protein PMIN07_003977 [Paraphaeosphaeria minitans]
MMLKHSASGIVSFPLNSASTASISTVRITKRSKTTRSRWACSSRKTSNQGCTPSLLGSMAGDACPGHGRSQTGLQTGSYPLVHDNNAIVVSPNDRLLPEHNGNDIQEDLADFWMWFKDGGVTDYLSSQAGAHAAVQLDYTRVLAGGDSAGGYLAIQSGLTQPRGPLSAIIGCYPMTNYLRRQQEAMFMKEPSPPESIIDVSPSTSCYSTHYGIETSLSVCPATFFDTQID